ncbi:hypothetical protein Mapa_012622 [Marchantia paleacea]|nr:hypothetical protein Mapa_012622 [Marchantia paleacea]
MIGGGVFWEENMVSAASREFLSLRRENGDSCGPFSSRAANSAAAAATQDALSKFKGSDPPYRCTSADSPTTTLSIGGDSMPPVGARIPEDQSRETLLQLKPWSVSSDTPGRAHLVQQPQVSIDQSSGGEYTSHDNSSKGVKRKRTTGANRAGEQGSSDADDDRDVESGIVLCWGPLNKGRSTGDSPAPVQFPNRHVNGIESQVLLGLRQNDNCLGSSEDYSYQYGAATQDHGTLLRLGQTGGGESNSSQRRFVPTKVPGVAVSGGEGVQLGLAPAGGSSSSETPRFETTMDGIPVIDEGSSSARMSKTGGGFMPALLMGSQIRLNPSSLNHQPQHQLQHQRISTSEIPIFQEDPGVSEQELSMSIRASTSGGTTSTSGASGLSDRANKVCKFRGCSKGARGASGLCIAHGGGRRCEKQGCNKGAEGRTVYCKAHGGGRRCQSLGCTKSAEGKTDYCIGHGGGRRCSHEGCDKAARGRSGLCIRHGGGKRCTHENCTKSAEGYSGLCISHGGGRRCHYPECSKGAQGSTLYCKAHGGGKRCMIHGCNKGAEGSTPLCKGHGGGKRCMHDGGGMCTKSVHGGTLYCVAHGGGKRCQVEGCSKSARGRTDFCVRHGGGKRCKVDQCGKSAQGSTDFCKAHGGGKRCQWGVEGSGFGEPGKEACDKFARGKTGLCAAHSAQVQDRRVHGGAGLGPGLTPGLFRGLVSGSGQSRCSSMGGGVSSSSTSAMCSTSAREERTVHGNSMYSGLSGLNFSSMSRGAASSGSNISSVTNVALNGSSSTAAALAGNGDVQQLLHNRAAPCSVNSADASPAQGFGHSSLIPPQVLVPLSMQKKDSNASFSSRHMLGRPPRPPIHHMSDDAGVFNMGPCSLSLPEGRVYGGAVPEGRVHGGEGEGGGNVLAVPEGRVHGGGLMALLSREVTASPSDGMDSVSLGMATSQSIDVRWGHHSGPADYGQSVIMDDPHRMPERRVVGGSLGSDVGQFLAARMNLNFS